MRGRRRAALASLSQRVMRSAAGGVDAGITLKDLKRAMQRENIYGVQDGRYYVAVSLAEAESLRAAMRAAKREVAESDGASDGRLVPFAEVELGLRVAAPGGNGALLEATPGYAPAELFQASTATQCFRFLDSQMDFETHEVSPPAARAAGFGARGARRLFRKGQGGAPARRGLDWRDTPLARALTTADEFALLASRASSSRVRHALRARKMRLLDAFRAFDGEAREGNLSYEALYGGLTWLGVELTPAQMMELARKIDVENAGFVTYEQFVDAFGPDDAWAEDEAEGEDEAEETNAFAKQKSEMTEEEAFYADEGDGDAFGAMVSAPRRDDSDLFGLSRATKSDEKPYDPLGALGEAIRRNRGAGGRMGRRGGPHRFRRRRRRGPR